MNDDDDARARAAKALTEPCRHCYAVPVVDATNQFGLPIAVGWTHEVGCPDWLPDWPS